MPERAAFYTWEAINAACLAVALVILLAASGLEPGSLLVLLALSILYPPVEWHFLCGQSNLPVLLLLAMCMRLMERGRDGAAGFCLAFAGLLRIFPLVLIGYLASAQRWRTLTWTLAWLAAGVLITTGLLGIRTFLSFANGLALVTDLHWLTLWQNIGLRAAISRCFWLLSGPRPEPEIELLRRIAVVVAAVWLLMVTILATLKLEQGKDPDWRAFGLWVVASVLLSPTSWVHYMVLFFIPFAQIVTACHANVSIRTQWAAILSYLAIVLVRSFPWPAGQNLPAWSAIAVAIGCFGSAVAAYLAAYWFTVDTRVAVEV